ncbi:hypothetical protein D3C71_1920210 [compost metagenome]
MLDAKILRQALLEGLVEAAGRQPAVQRGLDHGFELGGANQFSRRRHHALAWRKRRALALLGLVVLIHQLGDLCPDFIRIHVRSQKSVFLASGAAPCRGARPAQGMP